MKDINVIIRTLQPIHLNYLERHTIKSGQSSQKKMHMNNISTVFSIPLHQCIVFNLFVCKLDTDTGHNNYTCVNYLKNGNNEKG